MHSRRKEIKTRRTKRPPKIIEVISVFMFVTLLFVLGFILVSGISANRGPSQAYTYAMQTRQAMEQDQSVTPTPNDETPDDDVADPTLDDFEDPDRIELLNPDPAWEVKPTSTLRTVQKPEDQENILLLGSDARPDEGGFRTDIIVWVSLNPEGEFVSAISFPRDLFVYIPGYGENRINVAFPRGGFDLLAETFEVNFGIRPDHYLLVDFNGFKTVINNLGGITVDTAKNLSDSCATWINPNGWCSVGPGPVHMNGEVALWYARSRYSTNDIERARRAQEVIKAIFQRLMNLDIIVKAPELYNAYTTYVDTDIKLSDVLALLPLASDINQNGDIRSYVIGYDHAYDWMTMQGAQVLVPDYDKIREVIVEALALQ